MEKETNKTVVLHLVLKSLVISLGETHALVLYSFTKIKVALHAIANYGIPQKTGSFMHLELFTWSPEVPAFHLGYKPPLILYSLCHRFPSAPNSEESGQQSCPEVQSVQYDFVWYRPRTSSSLEALSSTGASLEVPRSPFSCPSATAFLLNPERKRKKGRYFLIQKKVLELDWAKTRNAHYN